MRVRVGRHLRMLLPALSPENLQRIDTASETVFASELAASVYPSASGFTPGRQKILTRGRKVESR